MSSEQIVYDGITFTYKPHHGAWFSDPEHEAIDSLCMPAFLDGTPDYDNLAQIDVSAYAAAGEVCEIACDLCLAEQARDERIHRVAARYDA